MFATVRRVWAQATKSVSDEAPSKLDRRRLLVLLLAMVLAEVGYVFLASFGRWNQFSFLEDRIDQLAEAFRAGHLHLLREPPAELLKRVNPFDRANAALWYWDASLYGGHYYFYWGPVPALLLALAKIVLRVSRPLGDYYPFLGLVTLQLVAGTWLIERLTARLYRRASNLQLAGAVLLFAFANPTPFMLARPAIYEAAIVGGQAFVLFGLALTLEAMASADRRRASNLYALAAGAAFGLALGCRTSLGPGLGLVCVAAAVFAARQSLGDRARRFVESLAAFGLLFGGEAFALLAYNHLRFDHWFEFGQRYQLTWIAWQWSPAFIPANLYSFALRPGVLSCHFPFVRAPMDIGATAFPAGTHLPPGYFVYESLLGSLVSVPWLWLGLAAFLPRRRAPTEDGEPESGLRRPMATLLLIAGTLTLAPVLFAPSATMRYMGDYTAPLVMLGLIGAGHLEKLTAVGSAAHRAVKAGVVTLALLTMAIGFALGFTGYYNFFQVTSPALFAKLDARLSVCGKGP
jgi:hypothetical protein